MQLAQADAGFVDAAERLVCLLELHCEVTAVVVHPHPFEESTIPRVLVHIEAKELEELPACLHQPQWLWLQAQVQILTRAVTDALYVLTTGLEVREDCFQFLNANAKLLV